MDEFALDIANTIVTPWVHNRPIVCSNTGSGTEVGIGTTWRAVTIGKDTVRTGVSLGTFDEEKGEDVEYHYEIVVRRVPTK